MQPLFLSLTNKCDSPRDTPSHQCIHSKFLQVIIIYSWQSLESGQTLC